MQLQRAGGGLCLHPAVAFLALNELTPPPGAPHARTHACMHVPAGLVGDALLDPLAHGVGAALNAIISALPCRVTALSVCRERDVVAVANDM